MSDKDLERRVARAEQLLAKLIEREIEREKEREKERAAEAQRRKEEDERRKEEDERRKEEDERRREKDERRQAAADRRSKEIDQQLKELGKQIGGANNRWGKIVEDLVAGGLVSIAEKHMGVDLDYAVTRVRPKDRSWEIDVLAVNKGVVVAAEVKTTLVKEDVDAFLSRIMLPFTTLMPSHRNKTVYGVIAFVKVNGNESEVVRHAWSKGLLVVKAMEGTNRVLTGKELALHDYGRS